MGSIDASLPPSLTDDVEVILLGTGTSLTIPHVDCMAAPPGAKKCRICSMLYVESQKNTPRHTSAVAKLRAHDGRLVTIVIDVGNDFQQAAVEWFPRYGIRNIDAVLITHAHTGVMHGLDDVREWTLRGATQSQVDLYLSFETFQEITRAFPYHVSKEFASSGSDVAEFNWHVVEGQKPFTIGDTRIVVDPYKEHRSHGFHTRPVDFTPSPNSVLPASTARPSSTAIERNANMWMRQNATITSEDTNVATATCDSSWRVVQHVVSGRHHVTTSSQPGTSTRDASSSSLLQGPLPPYWNRVLSLPQAITGVPEVPFHGYEQPEAALGRVAPVQLVTQADDHTSSERTSDIGFFDPPAYQGHLSYQHRPVVRLVTQEQPDPLDPRRWILSHVEYTGGCRLPQQNMVEPAVLSILVADILDCGRRTELRRTDRYHNSAAFPDPEGLRKQKKFSVRFAFTEVSLKERPTQFSEYRKSEGSKERVPLSWIDFAVIVVEELCDFLGDTQLRLRHHVVDMRHLVIVRIVRRSRGSVQPVFQVHPYFWDLYP